MAGNTDLTTAVAAAGTFLGTLLAAFGWKKYGPGRPEPGKGETMAVILERLMNIERRLTEHDTRVNDVFNLLEKTSDAMIICQKDITRALTQLEERRQQSQFDEHRRHK
jgi:hypothetical protein